MSNLNPNIENVVKLLQTDGFTTVDSGDGQTQDFECDRSRPYVVIQIDRPSLLSFQAQRVKHTLQREGVEVEPIGMNNVYITASYDPADDTALIEVIGLTDDMLP